MRRNVVIIGHGNPPLTRTGHHAGHNAVVVHKGNVATFRSIFNSNLFKQQNKENLHILRDDIQTYDSLILQYELIRYKKCMLSAIKRKAIVELYDSTRNFSRR